MLRRIVAIPLLLAFIILFILTLVFFQISDTLEKPEFYNDQLQQADIYNYLYEYVLPAALEEAVIDKDPLEFGINITPIKPYIISMVKQTLPPEWLRSQVEHAISEVVPYVWKDTEGFRIDISLKDRGKIAARAAKDTLQKEDVYHSMYDQMIGLIAERAMSNMAELPPAFALSEEELEPILRTVLPAEWVLSQIDIAIDEVMPYFTKDKEQFTVKVDISGRLDAVAAVVSDVLQRSQTYDYLFNGVVIPTIKQNIQETTQLPIGMMLTDEEILWATKEILPLEWYQTRVTDVIGQTFSYLKGTQPNLEVVIPLADRKLAATDVLSKLADQKLESLIGSLPPCTETQLADMLSSLSSYSLLTCKPVDMSYSELKELLGIDIDAVVAPLVDMWLPAQLTFTDADLRQVLGDEDAEDMLEQVRDWVQTGLIYTDQDLRDDLGANYERVEGIRQGIADGFLFTETDLRNWMSRNSSEQLQAFDSVRFWLGEMRYLKWVGWLILLFLLVGIGALGGETWSHRLLWSAAALATASIIAYAAFGPLFSTVLQPRINEAMIQMIGQTQGFQALLVDKGIVIAQNSINSLLGGLKSQALILIGVSLALTVLGCVWSIWNRR